MILNDLQNKKIVIFCPSNVVTGGTELLHQLCDQLNNQSIEAHIFYTGDSRTIPHAFISYNLKICLNIDEDNTILVLPETLTEFVHEYKNLPIFIWWLSVDNFFMYNSSLISTFHWNYIRGFRKMLHIIKSFVLSRNNKKLTALSLLKKKSIFHLYQSEYANHFLQKNKLHQALKLTDYINLNFINNSDPHTNKQDIVLYNPQKGYAFTRKLIKKYPEIRWIPIIGKTREEVTELLKISKVYIDFGHHPGKDRLPREAAINNCCIITSTNGSAIFFEDLPIPSEYKFNTSIKDIPKIKMLIDEIFIDYKTHLQNFKYYRKQIVSEYNNFRSEVNSIFKNGIY